METITCYTVDEAAAAFKVHKKTIYKHIKNGDIKAVKIGTRYRITEVEVNRLLQLNPQRAAQRAAE